MATENEGAGFICPDWAKPSWNRAECAIEKRTDESYAVVDHSLNGITIYVGTEGECEAFLNEDNFDAEEFAQDVALFLAELSMRETDGMVSVEDARSFRSRYSFERFND